MHGLQDSCWWSGFRKYHCGLMCYLKVTRKVILKERTLIQILHPFVFFLESSAQHKVYDWFVHSTVPPFVSFSWCCVIACSSQYANCWDKSSFKFILPRPFIIDYSLDCLEEPSGPPLCAMMKYLHGDKNAMASISSLHFLPPMILMKTVWRVMWFIYENEMLWLIALTCDCSRRNMKFYSISDGFDRQRPSKSSKHLLYALIPCIFWISEMVA